MTISATTQGIKPGVCLSTNRPVNPFDGQVIYMTDVDQTAVWDGSQWTVLAPIAGGRNVVINGAMQVAQRGTSTASVTVGGFYTVDRWNIGLGTQGTWTQSLEADAPTGSGLRNSLKMLCTTADASPAAADQLLFRSFFEGQNVQQFAKGTSSAKPFALSFWVKSNVTGTYIAELFDSDNSRQVSISYTISASATWEKKVIIFPADTTGVLDNDSSASLGIDFWLGAGSNFTSGTLQNTWVANVTANRAVGQTNLASAINNYWQVTGVQLEAGAVATPFEIEDIGTTLAKCQRYYFRTTSATSAYAFHASGYVVGTQAECMLIPPVPMRVEPTSVSSSNLSIQYASGAVYTVTATTLDSNVSTPNAAGLLLTIGTSLSANTCRILSNNSTSGYIDITAEL
jgi:hypothetical protein